MEERMLRKLLTTAVACALCAPAAHAAAGRRADLDLGFTTAAPGAPTGLTLRILYKDERDPNGKPQPIRDLILDLPEGTHFDGSALPRCSATDDELRTQGRGACPAASEIGRGSLSVMSGFPPPGDLVTTDTTLYNGGDQVIEVATQQGGDAPLGFDRLRFEGASRLHARPPELPGAPPDGGSVREVTARIEAHGAFVTTPGHCPAGGRWSASGTFGFLDSVRETVLTSIPCAEPGALSVRTSPSRVVLRRRTRIRVRVSSTVATCRAGATVRIGNLRATTDAAGTAVIVARLGRPGRHRVVARKPGCVPGLTVVRTKTRVGR
jgi:hypothetical protein